MTNGKFLKEKPMIKYLSIFVLVLGVSWVFIFPINPKYSKLKNPAKSDNIIHWSIEKKENAFKTFSKSLTFPTMYYNQDKEHFLKLIEHINASFPLVHSKLTFELIGPANSLLYTWKGKNEKKNPILLTAHLDVVPAPNPEKWSFPPFSGSRKDGYIYGRGSLDYKVSVIAQLEAVEELLRNNYVPERTVYLAYGNDEESSGNLGAKEITDYLQKKGVTLDFLLDEGGFITKGQFPTINKPIALISTCEKGFINLQLDLECEPGHASVPPNEQCIAIMSKSIYALDKHRPRAHISTGIFKNLLDHLIPHFHPIIRVIFSYYKWMTPLLDLVLSANPPTNALIRTTVSPTIFQSGIKDNVLPSFAKAVLNIRIHPLDSIKKVVTYVRSIIDKRINITILPGETEPSKVACVECQEFSMIYNTVENTFKDVIISPFLFVAASDSRHYRRISKNSYGFTPFFIDKTDVSKFHGFDERIHEDNYIQLIQFYNSLIQNVNENLN